MYELQKTKLLAKRPWQIWKETVNGKFLVIYFVDFDYKIWPLACQILYMNSQQPFLQLFFLDTLRVKIGMYVVVHCVSNANLYHTLDVNIELCLVTRLHVQYFCSVLGGTVMLSMPGLSYLTELLVHGHSSTGMQGPAPF